jgi:hypothetical protein
VVEGESHIISPLGSVRPHVGRSVSLHGYASVTGYTPSVTTGYARLQA